MLKAETEIKIAVAWLTDEDIIREITLKKISGVNVQIIISDAKENYVRIAKLKEYLKYAGVLSIGITKPFMHNKFAIIDDRFIINGSYNWSYGARSSEENIFIITLDKSVEEDTALLKKFQLQFQYLSHRVRAVSIADFEELNNFRQRIANPIAVISELDESEILLREEFEEAVKNSINNSLKANIQFDYTGLLQRMQKDGGGVEFVKRLINDEIQTGDMKSGFRKLQEPIPHRVDLSLEYLVSQERFQSLFEPRQVDFCLNLMKQYHL
ncbi:phospholipase D-like domain-containing protein [Flavobacterium johnsoniae]|uniref:phospholipase D-like domain-containing protein n=1 Tax=Flavobacterium johnsoniae TaxID=986 RepID=UPI0021CD8863|nr:phospholipase D-like domain-containing protein [Flavobacterium johnsoniae]WQG84037.1 phospholipase D-like domain-containing protein [Flavobacterium johnsoniae UW101]